MPELPEVETIVRGLRRRLVGHRIVSARMTHPSILKTPAGEITRALEGATVREVRRWGKNILLGLEKQEAGGRRREAGGSGQQERSRKRQAGSRSRPATASCLLPPSFRSWLIVHLGMTGQLVIEPPRAGARPHTHAWLELESGQSLRYTDIRRFGRIQLAAAIPPELARLGPDPLEIGEREFIARLRSRAARVKALLLDQRFLRGVGNIYADETLFRAGIHPAALGRRMSRKRAAKLWAAMREVLHEAIAHGGSSTSDYVDAGGRRGGFQLRHRVYGRGGQPCLNCGRTLRRAIIAGRSSVWCARCQRK
jgi:formamidopyrimidine-DNA glycosylase